MNSVLIIAEHDGRQLNVATGKCVACATQMDVERITVLVLGSQCSDVASQAAALRGVTGVELIDAPQNRAQLAAILAPQIAECARDYTHVFGPSTTFGKDLMPRVAALLGTGQISDIMTVEGPRRFKRPIYAGNAIVTVEAAANTQVVATIRTASFPSAECAEPAPVSSRQLHLDLPAHTRFVELRRANGDRPDLQSARKIVSGGRALGSAENFQLLYRLADKLGAAVGASRAAVDSGYVPNELQVGQTGKIVAPELYVAVGISGAIQHLTGIKDAKTIVAINKDAEAPIFEVADVGLVADLFEAVPALIDALEPR